MYPSASSATRDTTVCHPTVNPHFEASAMVSCIELSHITIYDRWSVQADSVSL